MSQPVIWWVLAYLLTYAVHGTLLMALAWAVTTGCRARLSDATAERLWKGAILGGFATAALQLILAVPASGSLARLAPTSPAATPAASYPSRDLDEASRLTATHESPGSSDLAVWYGLALAALAGAGLWHCVRQHRSLARLLADRVTCAEPTVRAALARFATRTGYRRACALSVSPSITSPVAFGILRPEICLPPRVLEALDPAALDGLLAHELAHHVRRDPLWAAALAVLISLLPWQPLLRLARGRLREIAEFRCDAAAAALADSRAVARCLVEVAGWVAACGSRGPGPLLATMARRGSPLSRRVDRLLGRHRAPVRPRPLLAATVLCTVLAGVTALAPGVRVAAGAGPFGRASGAPDPATSLAGLDADLATLASLMARITVDDPSDELPRELERRWRVVLARRRALGALTVVAAPGGRVQPEVTLPREERSKR